MQKKLALMLSVAVISLGLLACGSQNAGTSETMEPVETSTPEAATDEAEKATEESEETGNEAETENVEAAEQEENTPVCYMDSEGFKSDELGIMIRKDSADWPRFGMTGSLMNEVSSDNNTRTITNFDFTCNYYEGDLDSYISEQKGMEKITLDNITFAVREPSENYFNREIAFVGNGIALSITLWDYEIEDIWKNGLNSFEEDETDYLAYFKDETLYCPALGIKFSDEDEYVDNSISFFCSDYNSAHGGGNISIDLSDRSNAFYRGSNAEETLDNYVEQMMAVDSRSAIDETVEKTVANLKFLGRGYTEYGSENWLFVSDEAAYRISIFYTEGHTLEDYISVIEEIK